MKFYGWIDDEGMRRSRPAWDAWIEIKVAIRIRYPKKSRPAWDAWIEIWWLVMAMLLVGLSRPAWDAWIEIA